jgi:uncharacterized protein (TIGR00255 family)
MTGFGRAEIAHAGAAWVWEARSVNGRGLDLKFRLPPGFEPLEAPARDLIKSRFRRGSFQTTLSLARETDAVAPRLDLAWIDHLIAAAAPYVAAGAAAPPRWDGLLLVKGAVTTTEGLGAVDLEALTTPLLEALGAALTQLAGGRAQEGAALAAALTAALNDIDRLTRAAEGLAEAAPAALAQKLAAKAEGLLAGAAIDPQRLAQEIALLAAKADIREELVRLAAHAGEARALLAGPEPAGRRLEFLVQELNREANTLCAKSNDLALTRIGLDLKTAIDQLREQAANVE